MPASRLWPVLCAATAFACGDQHVPTAPPPSELMLVVVINPIPTGGMRPPATVTARVFLEGVPAGTVVQGVLDSAELTVFGGDGGLLASETVAGPLTFGADGTVTVRGILDWMPAEVLGRRLIVRFTSGSAVIEQAFTF